MARTLAAVVGCGAANVALAMLVKAPDPPTPYAALESLAWTIAWLLVAALVARTLLARAIGSAAGVDDGLRAALLAIALLQPVVNGRAANLAACGVAVAFGVARWYGQRSRPPRSPVLPTLVMPLAALATFAAVTFALWFQATPMPELLPRSSPTPGRESVFLITIDTLRADRLDAQLPDGAPLMPNVRELMASATRFTQARSPSPWTKPTMASVLTGFDPMTHGVTTITAALPPQILTVAERLRSEAGFVTGGVVSNAMLPGRHGFSRGFEHWIHYPRPRPAGRSIGDEIRARLQPAPDVTTSAITDHALDIIEAAGEEPLFLWVHYLGPHVPYEPPDWAVRAVGVGPGRDAVPTPTQVRDGTVVAPEQRRLLEQLYDADTLAVDAEVGRLLTALQRSGQFDRALVILTADHGEEFWEHGSYEHGHSLHDELLRVPLLLKAPQQRTASVDDGLVSITQIADVILEHAALPPREGAPVPPLGPVPFVVAGQILYGRSQAAVITPQWKLVVPTGAEDESHLYDLLNDPGEQVPLAAGSVEVGAELGALLAAQLVAASELRERLGVEGETVPLSEELERQLRSLGYIR